jgi:uncharacterized protein (DUF1697 family)
MLYLALLRGINVGGNAVLKMADLKKAVEAQGFSNVSTYIQSGNLIFESTEIKSSTVAAALENIISNNFQIKSKAVLRTFAHLEKVVSGVPAEWKTRDDLRCYLAFTADNITPQDVMSEVKLREGVDFMQAGDGVLYMTTLLSGLTKSGFTKLVSTRIYQDITMRNYNTVQKLFALMRSNQ